VRYLILSDIHGNLEALDAVLAALPADRYDTSLVLGDLVGYGANPNEVINRIRSLEPAASIRGNHDKVAAGLEDGDSFNAVARNAVEWTVAALTAENRAWLAALPPGPLIVDDLVEICHGAPFDEDAYVFDELDALRALESARRPVCVFGHTHVALAFERTSDSIGFVAGPGDTDGVRVSLDPRFRYLINPGSVGQPRDGDPRACAAIIDTKARAAELLRVAYPVEETQRKIRMAGLPDVLARRLGLGR
jgi:predicted phosphodiesterase